MKALNAWLRQYKWLNKYTLTIVAFAVWIVFLDGKFSVMKQFKLNKQITELKETKGEYINKVAVAKAEYNDLISNQEKYAREKYFISKEGEEVYIIE